MPLSGATCLRRVYVLAIDTARDQHASFPLKFGHHKRMHECATEQMPCSLQENNIHSSLVPSSPEYKRPPKRARTLLRSRPGPRGTSGMAWQQAGICLRINNLPAEPRLLVPQVCLPFGNASVFMDGKKLAHFSIELAADARHCL